MAPAIADSTVYIGSADGNLYGQDLLTGEELWKWNLGAPVSSSAAIFGNLLFVGASDGHLYAFCEANSTALSAVPDEATSPTDVRFSLPSPNPSDSPVKIAWTMDRAAHVTVQIFDLRGRLFRTLLDERRQSGARQRRLLEAGNLAIVGENHAPLRGKTPPRASRRIDFTSSLKSLFSIHSR